MPDSNGELLYQQTKRLSQRGKLTEYRGRKEVTKRLGYHAQTVNSFASRQKG
jgi:hypothetical protein